MHWLAPRRVQQRSAEATAEIDDCCPQKTIAYSSSVLSTYRTPLGFRVVIRKRRCSQLSRQLDAIQVAQQSHAVAWILLCSMVVAGKQIDPKAMTT